MDRGCAAHSFYPGVASPLARSADERAAPIVRVRVPCEQQGRVALDVGAALRPKLLQRVQSLRSGVLPELFEANVRVLRRVTITVNVPDHNLDTRGPAERYIDNLHQAMDGSNDIVHMTAEDRAQVAVKRDGKLQLLDRLHIPAGVHLTPTDIVPVRSPPLPIQKRGVTALEKRSIPPPAAPHAALLPTQPHEPGRGARAVRAGQGEVSARPDGDDGAAGVVQVGETRAGAEGEIERTRVRVVVPVDGNAEAVMRANLDATVRDVAQV